MVSLTSVLIYDLPILEMLPSRSNPTLTLNHKNYNPSPMRNAKKSDCLYSPNVYGTEQQPGINHPCSYSSEENKS